MMQFGVQSSMLDSLSLITITLSIDAVPEIVSFWSSHSVVRVLFQSQVNTKTAQVQVHVLSRMGHLHLWFNRTGLWKNALFEFLNIKLS